MFDIGFSELLLIAIVGLIVVGPEKLPSTIRTCMRYIRQFKNGFAHIRDEVERELALDELKDDLQANKKEITKSVGYDELQESLHNMKAEAESLQNFTADDWIDNSDIEDDLDELEADFGSRLPDADEHADTGVEAEIIPHNNPKKQDKQ